MLEKPKVFDPKSLTLVLKKDEASIIGEIYDLKYPKSMNVEVDFESKSVRVKVYFPRSNKQEIQLEIEEEIRITKSLGFIEISEIS